MKLRKLSRISLIDVSLILAAVLFNITSAFANASSSHSHKTHHHLRTPHHQTQAHRHIDRHHPTGQKTGKQYYTHQEIAKLLGWVQVKDSGACGLCDGYYKQPETVLSVPHPKPIFTQETRVTAKGPTLFVKNGESILQKDVVITQPGRIIRADKAYIYSNKKTGRVTHIKLVGNVRAIEDDTIVITDEANINLVKHTQTFAHTVYHTYVKLQIKGAKKKKRYSAWGTAAHAKRLANGVILLYDATYSTCAPSGPTWEVYAGKLKLNKKKEEGKARNAVVWVKHLPVLYLPYYSFPLSHKRKSGFLTPNFRFDDTKGTKQSPVSTGDSGFQFSLPYYWNIAPNYDLLITPHYMSKRGLEMNALFRYLTEFSSGLFYLSFIPDDRVLRKFIRQELANNPNPSARLKPYINALSNTSTNRAYFAFKDATDFNRIWYANIELNYVTDPYYFADLGVDYNTVISNQLLNQISVLYNGLHHWQFSFLLQAYQTLHPITQISDPAISQYSRYPELDVSAEYPNLIGGIHFDLSMQAVNFEYHSDFPPFTFQRAIGQRVHIRPSLSRPFTWAWGFVTPELSLDSTFYNVGLATPTSDMPRPQRFLTRNLPILDLDTGLYFDHYFHVHHHSYVQTFEPRLFYLYVPFENQADIPVFDTQRLPFSFAQLFSLNEFTGFDRLQNANQVSVGITSKIMNSTNAHPILAANLGFIYYFQQPKVLLSPFLNLEPPSFTTRRQISPLVGELTYYPYEHWTINSVVAWNFFFHRLANASVGVGYNFDDKDVISVGYNFARDIDGIPINGVDLNRLTDYVTLAFGWSFFHNWSVLGYVYYNIAEERPQGYYAGIEYDTCCWAFRFILSRSYLGTTTTGQNQFKTVYLFQLQLKGLGNYGNNKQANTLVRSTLPRLENPFD